MKNKRIEFNKEKIAAYSKVCGKLLTNASLQSGLDGTDIVNDLFTIKLEGWILSNMAEKRTLIYYCDRPTFFDWLFRRIRTVKWKIEVKDLLLNPPELKDGTTRIYIPHQIED